MWITVPFDAANYVTTGLGIWTVRPEDQITLTYMFMAPDTVALNWVIGNTNVSGNPVGLKILLPPILAPVHRLEPLMYFTDADELKQVGWADINPANSVPCITHYKFDLSPWGTTNSRNTALHGSAVFEVIV